MRIVILGTGPFALPTCRRLLASEHSIPLVVTRPVANPQAKKQPPRPVYEWAKENDLATFEPASINEPEAIQVLDEQQADLFFVCDYGQILSKQCLGVSRLGGINLHGSLLPRHRGAAPVQWTLLRGDEQAGITVIHMSPRLDAGPALAVQALEILPDETAEQLEPRLAELGVAATLEAIEQLAASTEARGSGAEQDPERVTRAPRFSKPDGRLDFRLPAEYLARLVRACQPWPGTYAELQRPDAKHPTRVIIRSARAISQLPMPSAKPGTALAMNAQQLGLDWSPPWQEMLGIHTGQGMLLVSRLQPAGKRVMEASEFMRGHPLKEGSHFVLPEPPLEPLA